MADSSAQGPNAAQREYWSGPGGSRWVVHKAPHDAMSAPLTAKAMELMNFAPGEHVLDIGCGSGATTFEIARRVGPAGAVTGADFSEPMLVIARAQPTPAGAAPVVFEHADAQTHDFAPARFDAAFSRFGVMFFTDPAAAFANIRRGMAAGGRLGFLCWRHVKENSWASVTIGIARRRIALPPSPGPEDPGPYSFRDPDRVRRILGEAGWSDVAIEPLDAEAPMGADLEQGITNCLTMGPLTNAITSAPDEARAAIAAELRQALPDYLTDAGVIMGAAVWMVTARP